MEEVALSCAGLSFLVFILNRVSKQISQCFVSSSSFFLSAFKNIFNFPILFIMYKSPLGLKHCNTDGPINDRKAWNIDSCYLLLFCRQNNSWQIILGHIVKDNCSSFQQLLLVVIHGYRNLALERWMNGLAIWEITGRKKHAISRPSIPSFSEGLSKSLLKKVRSFTAKHELNEIFMITNRDHQAPL